MVSITGSTQAGISVAEKAARTVKRVTLELGGKSALVLLDDSDLAAALPVAVRSLLVNNGQSCSALTRLIVPRGQVDAVEEGLADLVGAMQVGDPLDATSDVGPVVSAGARTRILDLTLRPERGDAVMHMHAEVLDQDGNVVLEIGMEGVILMRPAGAPE